MSSLVAEFIGTTLLILLGNGVVANVLLTLTKGKDSGWIVIAFGWGMAVFIAVIVAGSFSGAHINPAVTLGFALTQRIEWAEVPGYLLFQLLGSLFGALLVYLHYKNHFDQTEDPDDKLAVFATGPAIRNKYFNFLSEVIGTFVLVFCILFMVPGDGLGSLDALPTGLLIFSIGLSLGGTTGYAINPARDLGPRIFHFLAPIKNKRDSDWNYSWIPVFGPFTGALLAGILYNYLVVV